MAYTYLPINLSTKNLTCLVVGGGAVALRKIETLMDYQMDITVVAPEIHDKIGYFAERGLVKTEQREYRSPEAADFGLVISASNNEEINQTVHDDARSAGVLVNVVDNPPLCDFTFPAVVRRDALSVAVSTDGKAPFLSGHLRSILETIFPEHWNKMMNLAGQFRKMVQQRWPDSIEQRMACFGRFVEADWKVLIKEKSDKDLDAVLQDMLVSGGSEPGAGDTAGGAGA